MEEDLLQSKIRQLTLENERLRESQQTYYTKTSLLSNQEIQRYARQIIIPSIGVTGQSNLRRASVLVVGAGGLGSPCLLYLAASGIGKIGIIDYDVVEASNLSRQIIHDISTIGMSKVESAKARIEALSDPFCKVVTFNCMLTNDNATDIFNRGWDCVVDASDNPATRYLVNDICVMMRIPLISGSALKMDGQLTVYGYGNDGPCYRCLFPHPPPRESVTNCSDGGILGVVTGIIGCLQALEAIKIASGIEPSYSKKLLLFDAMSGSMRIVKLRGKQESCAVCSSAPTITKLIDYIQFCGGSGADDKVVCLNILDQSERVSAVEFKAIHSQTMNAPILLDVREQTEYNIASLPNSVCIPWRIFESKSKEIESLVANHKNGKRGNDSQLAVRYIQEKLKRPEGVYDVIGGFTSWALEVDDAFPKY